MNFICIDYYVFISNIKFVLDIGSIGLIFQFNFNLNHFGIVLLPKNGNNGINFQNNYRSCLSRKIRDHLIV